MTSLLAFLILAILACKATWTQELGPDLSAVPDDAMKNETVMPGPNSSSRFRPDLHNAIQKPVYLLSEKDREEKIEKSLRFRRRSIRQAKSGIVATLDEDDLSKQDRAQLRDWITYHKVIGVQYFWLFSQTQTLEAVLKESGLYGVSAHVNVTTDAQSLKIWDEIEEHYAWNDSYNSCDFDRAAQIARNLQVGLKFALDTDIHSVFHISTDELIYPAGYRGFNVKYLLLDAQYQDLHNYILPTYDAIPETTEVQKPFSQVTLFRKSSVHASRNFQHVFEKQHQRHHFGIWRPTPFSRALLHPSSYVLPNGTSHPFLAMFNISGTANESSNVDVPHGYRDSTMAFILSFSHTKKNQITRGRACDCKEKPCDASLLSRHHREFEVQLHASEDKSELERWFEEQIVHKDEDKIAESLRQGVYIRAHEPQVILAGVTEAENQR